MINNNPYLAHSLAKERVNDAVREAEQARLVGEAKAAKKTVPTNSLFRKMCKVGSALISFGRIKSEALVPHGERTA